MTRPRVGTVAIAVVLATLVLAAGAVLGAVRLGAAIGGSDGAPVDVASTITPLPGGWRIETTVTGSGLSVAQLDPALAEQDTGYVRDAAERTSGRALAYRDVDAELSSDRSSGTIRYTVEGDVVYVLPLSRDLVARSLEVAVDGGRITSCLTQYGTSNGTPRLRPCNADGRLPLRLDRRDNGLAVVRLELRA